MAAFGKTVGHMGQIHEAGCIVWFFCFVDIYADKYLLKHSVSVSDPLVRVVLNADPVLWS